MEEVASLFPDLVVTGVHRVVRREGGWYAEVTTRMRTRETWKRTMPTHGETKTRVTMPLEPTDPADTQLDEIRDLSQKVLDDPEALLVLVGEPETGDDAATMLDALRTVEGEGEPASDAEAAVVAVINDYLGEPSTSQESAGGDTGAQTGDASQTASEVADEPLKTCLKCDTPKGLSEFRRDRRSKDGRASTCKACKKKAERKVYRNKKRDTVSEPKTGDDTASTTPEGEASTTAGVTGNGGGTIEDWRRQFVNPTLEQLEHLRAFLGAATFDETVDVVKEIRVDHGS